MMTFRIVLGSAFLLTACSGATNATMGHEQTAAQALTSTVVGDVAETDIVGDRGTGVLTTDANLINAWGLAFAQDGTAWIANNGTGTSAEYDEQGQRLRTIVFPSAKGAATTPSPTGLVFNPDATKFYGDQLIFAAESGRIYGWQQTKPVVVRVDEGGSAANYKGIAIAETKMGERIYAADFHNAKIDIFDDQYQLVSMPDAFADREIPAGYAPFNIQMLAGNLYVTYAKQDAKAQDAVNGIGNGFVDVFDTSGYLLQRIASNGTLNAPWALAIAPAGFGSIQGSLLVGNFGDGMVNVYDISQKSQVEFKGQLAKQGAPLSIDGLWSLVVGPNESLYFTAGPQNESHGLFGRIDALMPVGSTAK